MPANPLKVYSDKLARQAKEDPKKAGVLVALVCVMCFSWYRMMAGGAAGPARAGAATTSDYRVTGAVPADNTRAGRSGDTVVALQEWARQPIAPLSRNFFVINYDFFPQDGSKPVVAPVARGDGFWDHVAKSMALRADQKREHEVLVENLKSQALQLRLESTMMGASPKALVNGQLVGVGDVVASFRVCTIDARRIVVEREGIKLEIRSN
jgi:hypothetical protein